MKPPSIRVRVPRLFASQKIQDPFWRASLVRLVLLLVLAVSAWLVWGSVGRLTLADRELKQKSSSVAALADEVQQLERKVDASEIARADGRFQEAKELLFTGPEEYAKWENDLREQATALQLDATYQRGASRTQTNGGQEILIIPVTIDLAPALDASATNSPYRRLLSFTRIVQKPNRRVDLLELVVAGDSNSVRQAKATVHIWSQEAKP